jgi:hypothetical protein
MKPIEILLDECLRRMEQGERLEDCLAAYPQQQAALRPLLEAAAAVRAIPAPVAPAAAFEKGRAQMFAAFDQEFLAPPVSKSTLSRYTEQIIAWITGKENLDMNLIKRLAIALTIVMVVLAGLGTTAVSASNALPGDLLYPLKASAQSAQLMFTFDQHAREELQHHFEAETRDDVRTLMNTQRPASVNFIGVLEQIDGDTWTIGGLPVTVDATSALNGTPAIGNRVHVLATVQADGSILARRVIVAPPDAGKKPDFDGAYPPPGGAYPAPGQTGTPVHEQDQDHDQEQEHDRDQDHLRKTATPAAPTPTAASATSTASSQYNEDWFCHKCVTPTAKPQDSDHANESDPPTGDDPSNHSNSGSADDHGGASGDNSSGGNTGGNTGDQHHEDDTHPDDHGGGHDSGSGDHGSGHD